MRTFEIVKLILAFIGAASIICSIAGTILYICFTHDIKMPAENEMSDITIDDLVN